MSVTESIKGWYCEHQDKVITGPEASHWEMYCRANRRCEVGLEGCHAILIPVNETDKGK